MRRRGQYVTKAALHSVFFARWWSGWMITLGTYVVTVGAIQLFLGQVPAVVAVGIGVALVVAVQLLHFRQSVADRRQVEAMVALCAAVKTDVPLPTLGGWTVGADFANLLVTLIRRHEPKLIVEAGSGASTIVIGHCLRALGAGRVVSLEHDERSVAMSRANVGRHGLSAFAEVVHAPLRDHPIEDRMWSWYDTAALTSDAKIDLLVVDGPPIRTQRMARYPALPILFDRLNAGCVVLLDDASRRDEQRVVAAWRSRYDADFEFVGTGKGAMIIARPATGAAPGTILTS